MSIARRALLPALVFAIALVTFLPGLSGEFVKWDDYDNVVNNTGVHGLRAAQLKWMWTGTVLGHWIPLTWMSFGLNYALDGVHPRGYHLLNLLLHAASATVFFFIARRLPPSPACPSGRASRRCSLRSIRYVSSPSCGSRSGRTSSAGSSSCSRSWPT